MQVTCQGQNPASSSPCCASHPPPPLWGEQLYFGRPYVFAGSQGGRELTAGDGGEPVALASRLGIGEGGQRGGPCLMLSP